MSLRVYSYMCPQCIYYYTCVLSASTTTYVSSVHLLLYMCLQCILTAVCLALKKISGKKISTKKKILCCRGRGTGGASRGCACLRACAYPCRRCTLQYDRCLPLCCVEPPRQHVRVFLCLSLFRSLSLSLSLSRARARSLSRPSLTRALSLALALDLFLARALSLS